jgi:hypothetical protein
MLVGWYVKYAFPRVYTAANAGAYLVNSNYYDKLLANREESLREGTSWKRWATSTPWNWTVDVYWNKLMRQDNWYCLYPCICRQTNTYSDISKVTYNAQEIYGIYTGKGNLFDAIQNAEQKDTTSRK